MRGAGQKGQRGGERRSSRGPTLKYGLLNATTVPTNIPCPLNCFEKDAPILMPWILLPPLESFLASVGLVPFGGFIWVTNSVSGGKANARERAQRDANLSVGGDWALKWIQVDKVRV